MLQQIDGPSAVAIAVVHYTAYHAGVLVVASVQQINYASGIVAEHH